MQALSAELTCSVELSPFTFPDSPSRVFTGSKSSSLLTIDLQTGEQIDSFSSHNPNASLYARQVSTECIGNEDALDRLEKECRRDIEERPNDMLFVGRTGGFQR